MLRIDDKSLCCGCSACVSICPQECIEFRTDIEGFNYPQINIDKCIKCGKCNRVCPVISQHKTAEFTKAFAAKNINPEIQLTSSSGGVFYAVAKTIISQGGIVAGVCWSEDFLEARFELAETLTDIEKFMTSKYLQAKMGNIYCETQKILQSGRELLFCGTPCQIAGLYHFLGHDYANLFTVEVICHGVPSSNVWQKYISALSRKNKWQRINAINFRDKMRGGQNNYCFRVNADTEKNVETTFSQKFSENLYMRAFLQNLSLRPSCYNCSAKAQKSGANLSIGDFWGINTYYPELYDKNGVSCIVANNSKGLRLLNECNDLFIQKVKYEYVLAGNAMLEKSVACPEKRNEFWKLLLADRNVENVLHKTTKEPWTSVMRNVAVTIIAYSGLKPLMKKLLGYKNV